MTSPPQPGVLFTGTYRKFFGNPGVPGAPTVFDELANPPAGGIAAQEAAITEDADLGVIDPPASATYGLSHNFDPVKNFYDAAGVLGVENDLEP